MEREKVNKLKVNNYYYNKDNSYDVCYEVYYANVQ